MHLSHQLAVSVVVVVTVGSRSQDFFAMLKFVYFICFNLIILTCLVAAKVPSYIPVCGRRDPNLNKCIRRSLEALRPVLRVGILELNVPAIEPLILKRKVRLNDAFDLKTYAHNFKLWNLPEYQVRKFSADLQQMSIDSEIYFDKVKLLADFDVRKEINIFIHERGSVEIFAKGVKLRGRLRYHLIDNQIFFHSMTTKLDISDYIAKVSPREGQDPAFAEAMITILTTYRQELLKIMLPSLEKAISYEILDLANDFCKNFTYDDLFPDHE